MFVSEQSQTQARAKGPKVTVVIAGNHDLTFDCANYSKLWRRFGHSRKFDTDMVKDKL